MDLFTVFLFVVGFVALVGGAELLVRGAARLAALFGLSSLVIGLTVVAFGTSAPELAVGLQGVLAGEPDIALGNVVGSNIANILLILGIAAAITPLAVAAELVRWDIPLMIGASMVVYIMALDGEVSHFDGALLTLGILVYLILAIAYGRKPPGIDEVDTDDASSRGARAIAINGVLVGVGLVALVLGARLLVTAAVTVAQALGVSELVIGLTVIAIGTSLPEVATSVVAAAKGERDIAVGNAVGSNMFNLLAVLGITAT
ncbi:MAG: calcium/sodium antiporter, partial [Candidatus Competibacterales bacterium]